MSRLEWAVIVQGEPGEIARRVRTHFEALDVEPAFAVAPGTTGWHLVYGTGHGHFGREGALADELAETGSEVVYALALGDDEPYALAIRSGGSTEVVGLAPDELARSLGCPLPDAGGQPAAATPRPELHAVALLEGLGADEARAAYRSAHGQPPPPDLQFDATPGGVVLHGPACDKGFADLSMSEVLPEVTVYRVTTSARLEPFMVQIVRGGEPVGHFDLPPWHDPFSPAVEEVKGSREPAAILAALGIPPARFGA